MKKITAALLSVLLLLSLTACEGFNLTDLFINEPDWDTVTIETPTKGSAYKYYYELLSNKEKQSYVNILDIIHTFPEAIEVPFLDESELTKVFEALLYDNPELFFLDRNCTTTRRGTKAYFNAQYLISLSDYAAQKQALFDTARDIVAQTEGMSAFDKELFIHDYLVRLIIYDDADEGTESNAYGALILGKAACEGYAKATKLLLDMAGIECYVVNGSAVNIGGGRESHMWNIVNIDGDYYHLDTTWNDPVSADGKNSGKISHTYFNLTDDEIANTHSGFRSIHPCTQTDANYFRRMGLYFETYSEQVLSRGAKALAQAVDAERQSAELRFAPTAFTNAKRALIDRQELFSLVERADRLTAVKLADAAVSYTLNDNFGILEIILEF